VTATHYTVLAGGTGAAKFLRGLVQVVRQEDIHVVVNVGDDTDIWGLHISPDIDSILYALSGRLDVERGWGVRDETFRCLEEMSRYGMPDWFRLGDRDLATHIMRSDLLRSGQTLTAATARMAAINGYQGRCASGDVTIRFERRSKPPAACSIFKSSL
jgi:LPPG:FO 2-phospho-L-lactate transferase